MITTAGGEARVVDLMCRPVHHFDGAGLAAAWRARGVDVPGLVAGAGGWLARLGRTDVVDRIVTAILPALPVLTRAETLLWLGDALDRTGHDQVAMRYAGQALDHDALPEPLRLRLIELRARALLTGAVAARRLPAGHTCGAREERVTDWLVRALVATDRLTEADTALDVMRPAFPGAMRARWHLHRARVRLATGALTKAAAEAEEGLATRPSPPVSGALRAIHAEIAGHRGEPPAAEETMIGDAESADAAWCRLLRRSVRQPAPTEPLLPRCEACRATLFAEHPLAAATVVRVAGRADLAAAAVAAARAVAAELPYVATLAAASAHAEGLYLRDLPTLRRAVELYRSGSRSLELGHALADAATLSRLAGDHRAAAALRTEATKLVGGPPRPTRRIAAGWESLTDAELRVVSLIAEGLTNRETAARLLVSPHTVNCHVRHVFTKLDINRRVELVSRFVARQRPAGLRAI
jgi:DNA-binding CsgD family transcriptional regulator